VGKVGAAVVDAPDKAAGVVASAIDCYFGALPAAAVPFDAASCRGCRVIHDAHESASVVARAAYRHRAVDVAVFYRGGIIKRTCKAACAPAPREDHRVRTAKHVEILDIRLVIYRSGKAAGVNLGHSADICVRNAATTA